MLIHPGAITPPPAPDGPTPRIVPSPNEGAKPLPEPEQPTSPPSDPRFLIHEEALVIRPWEAKFAEGSPHPG